MSAIAIDADGYDGVRRRYGALIFNEFCFFAHHQIRKSFNCARYESQRCTDIVCPFDDIAASISVVKRYRVAKVHIEI